MSKDEIVALLPQMIPQVMHPDVEWIEDPGRADSRTYHGHDGVIESWRQWLENWDEYGGELEGVKDCGGDEVFAVFAERGRGAASGASVESRLYVVVTVRDQKIARWREFYDEAAAREAAGLAG